MITIAITRTIRLKYIESCFDGDMFGSYKRPKNENVNEKNRNKKRRRKRTGWRENGESVVVW